MEQVLIIRKIDELMGPVQHIAELIGKNAAVPQSAPGDILSRHCRRRLFLKGVHLGDGLGGFRDDVAVFFAGIGRLDAHEHQIGLPLVCLGAKALQRLKVVVIHIGVHRAHHHGFILGHTHHVHQVGSGQGNGREGVPPAGLYGDAHILPQLVVDQRHLGLGGGNGHPRLGIRLFDLAENPLDHGLIGSLFVPEYFDKLLGPNVVAQGPQPLTGAAGQQYQIHTRLLTVLPA